MAPTTPTLDRQTLASWLLKLGAPRSMPAGLSPQAGGLLLVLLGAFTLLALAIQNCTLRKTNAKLRARLDDFDGFETCFQQGFRALYEQADEAELRATQRALKRAEPVTAWTPHEVLLDVHQRAVREFLNN